MSSDPPDSNESNELPIPEFVATDSQAKRAWQSARLFSVRGGAPLVPFYVDGHASAQPGVVRVVSYGRPLSDPERQTSSASGSVHLSEMTISAQEALILAQELVRAATAAQEQERQYLERVVEFSRPVELVDFKPMMPIRRKT